MNHEKFIKKCVEIVAEKEAVEPSEVFMVWSCKVLQNSKALFSTPYRRAPYYEITLNGDKNEIYVDCYTKKSNEHIEVNE